MNAQTFLSVVARKLFSTFQIRRFVTKCLIVVLLSTQTFATPQLAVVYAEMVTGWKQEARLFYYAQGWGSLLMAFWQGKLSDKPTKPSEKTQEKQSDRDAQVVKLQIAPGGDLTIATGERITFNALALSSEGGAVSGVKFNWAVEDISVDQAKRKGKPVITDRGVFYSPIAGEYLISVKDSKVQANTKVIVKGDPQPPIDKLIEKYKPFSYGTLSSREVAEAKPTPNKIGSVKPARQATSLVAQNSEPTSPLRSAKDLLKQAKSLQYAKGMVATMPVVQAGGDPCGWNNSNWTTADDSGKERGDMPGRASDGDAGSGNYEFSAPVIGLDSRGLDLELSMDFNSRLWHKANSDITFDIDHDWPAPGWNIGFGRIVSMGSDRGFMIIDGDGTRHGYTGNALAPSGWQYFTGKTIDGTFTDYTVSANSGIPSYASARLSNGTTISYGAANMPPAQFIQPRSPTRRAITSRFRMSATRDRRSV